MEGDELPARLVQSRQQFFGTHSPNLQSIGDQDTRCSAKTQVDSRLPLLFDLFLSVLELETSAETCRIRNIRGSDDTSPLDRVPLKHSVKERAMNLLEAALCCCTNGSFGGR